MAAQAKKCFCGCGQASASSCRQRLAECSGCGVKVRLTRSVMAAVTLSCSCGGTLIPVCLEDRAASGDESAISELCWRETVSAVQSERPQGRHCPQDRPGGRAGAEATGVDARGR
jgi:hypothetical protein